MSSEPSLLRFGLAAAAACVTIGLLLHLLGGITLYGLGGAAVGFLLLAWRNPSSLAFPHFVWARLRRFLADLLREGASAFVYVTVICAVGLSRRLSGRRRIVVPFRSRSSTWIVMREDA